MTWLQFHSKSENFASEAETACCSRNYELAQNLYRQAAEFEQRALETIDLSKTRTRGITAVSTVALWYKAKEYTNAERLAYGLLAENNIPGFAREQLRDLVQAIWTESTKRKAQVEFLPGQVDVSVKGGEIVTGGAPLDLILEKMQSIQSILYRTIEYIQGDAHRKHGLPSKELQEVCRTWLFQSVPGSYQFSIAIQKPVQPDFFKQEIDPVQVTQNFLEIISASASQGTEGLVSKIQSDEYRLTFLKLTRNLAPTGKSFESINFRLSGDHRAISLNSESRTFINQNLRRNPYISVDESTIKELKGILRGVHLDKDWLEILSKNETVHIEGLQETVDDVIGPMVNRPVIVQYVNSLRKLKFVDIELDE